MLSIEEQFQNLLGNVKSQVDEFFPIEGRKRILRAKNIRFDKADPGRMLAWNDIQKAKDNEGSFLAMIRGDLELVDKATDTTPEKVVETKKNQVLAHVPHMTGLNSFVVNGKDLQVINQLRRRPGIYPKFTPDDNVKSAITSTGANYDVILNRQTGEYLMKVGTSNLKLVPFLRGLEVPEKDIVNVIGKSAYDENMSASGKRDELTRFWNKVRSKAPPADRNELINEIKEFMGSKPLDPNVTLSTVGASHSAITPSAILDATKAAREVANGVRQPADMESLVFKSLHSVEDFVGDRLKKAIPGIKARLGFQIDEKANIKSMFGPMLLSKPILSQFTTSEFTRYSDQNNPLDILGTSQGVTVMGEGGISDVHRVSSELRDVHASHLGFIDPLHTAEDFKIGLSNHLTEGVTKKKNQMYRKVWDVKAKKMVDKDPVELSRAVVAFPDQYTPDDIRRPKNFKAIDKEVLAMDSNTFSKVPASKVQYVIPSTSAPFSFVTNAIPFIHSNSGARMLMAGRHLEQAVSLSDREAPLVQSEYHGMPYDKAVGNSMLTAADRPGVVTKIEGNAISIKHDGERKATKYEIPDHYPLNSETFMTETPVVKVGDKVKAGQRLTDSNFSRNGDLALGKNLVTAFMPWRGHNFEDGIVISESAAKKLTSEHKHEMSVERDRNMKIGKKFLFAQFPDMQEHWSGREDDLPKPGDIIKPGEIIIPAIQEQKLGPQTDYSRIHKALHKPFKDASVRWRELSDGEVVRVVKNPNFVKVFVKTREPMQVGDKLSTRAGSKGIVTKIVPDNEMPRNESEEIVDVLFNPYGLPGRMNPGLMFESAMGKVSQKTGKPVVVKNFNNIDSQVGWVKDQLKQHKLRDTETISDPTHNRQHKDVLTGPVYWLKLKHQVRNKLSARGHADAYTIDGRPAKGGVDEQDTSTSAQSVGPLEIYSLMAGGHTEFLKDTSGVKSNRNVDFWNAYQTGQPTPKPVVPTSLDKFHSYLEGAGVRLTQEGDTLSATPFTDKDILARSKGRITEPSVVRTSGYDLVEEKGGLFDKTITGGLQGGADKWAHIELAERVLHPLYERPAQILTGLKKKEMDQVIAGKLFVDKDGAMVTSDAPTNLTGGEGVHRLLSRIDVPTELRSSRAKLSTANKTEKPKLLQKIKYLSALDKMGLNPADAYTNKYLPVIPPQARPIYAMDDGNLNVADPNHGYREVLFINKALEDLKKHDIGGEALAPMREGLYRATAGLIGLTQPLTRNANFKGFISQIAGQQNKHGLFQSKVVKRTQDLSGRSTLIVDPRLHMDHIGIPKQMAQKIFAPMAIRKMVLSYGLNPIDARDELQKLTPRSEAALRDVMAERPVIINRAPSLHKFSNVAVLGKLVDGQALQINPLTVGGLNADFDGDTAAIHVPVSEKARIEAFNKLPSKTLISPKDLKVIHAPSKEALFGLYYMTVPTTGKAVPVKNAQDVFKLLKDRKVEVNSPITYNGKRWTPGHFIINSTLPKEYQINNEPFTGGKIKETINTMARTHPKVVGDVISKLKDHGFENVSKLGFSVGLDDLDSPAIRKINEKLFPQISARAKKSGSVNAIMWGSDQAAKAMDTLKGNRFAEMTYLSGAGGKYKGNVQQMVIAPIGVTDTKGAAVPIPIIRGYSKGMDMGSYWATLPGMRKGLADRAISTADTGAFAKELNNTTIGLRIGSEDCKTTNGIELPVGHPDIQGRVVADGPFQGQTIEPAMMKQLRGKGLETLKVRSPATCALKHGVCAKCMGLNESGDMYKKGFHIGALVGTTISEPLTQMIMRCNAGDNLITSRHNGKVRILSLEQLWEELNSVVHVDDAEVPDSEKIELKCVTEWEVWDGNQWTNIQYIERHDPDDGMSLQLLENGRALVAQNNHPTWVRKSVVRCGCGSTSFTELGRSNQRKIDSPKKVYAECDMCGERMGIPEEEWLGFVESVSELKDTEGMFIQSHAPIEPEPFSPPVDPYVAGIYLAEGSVDRRQFGKIREGRRAGGNVPANLKARLPVAVSVSQNSGECQDYICNRLSAQFKTSVSGKIIRIHDSDLAKKFLGWFGLHAVNKSLPSQWLGAPKDWLIQLLAGLIDGDGTQDKESNRSCLDTTSLTLANQVAWIVERVGGRSRTYPTPWRDHSKNQGYRVDIYLPFGLPGFKKTKIADKKDFDDLSKVVGIKPVVYPHKVYDISTATRRFTANGVTTHNSFHTGAKVGGGEVGYRRIAQIFNMPVNIRGKAPLALTSGTVEKIVDTDRGGSEVTIGGIKHFVPTELKMKIKMGQKLSAGDRLSEHGIVHPREIARYKGIDAARDLLLNDIEGEMKGAGQNVRRRIYEAAIRPLIDKSLVIDPGDTEAKYHVQPGDIVFSNHVNEMNKGLKNPLKVEPHLMSIKEVPFSREDFIGPLMFQRIPRTLTKAPALGTKTKLKGMDSHPIVEYAYNKMASTGPVILWEDEEDDVG